MRTIFFYIVIVPIAVFLVMFGVTNREPVTVVLDPFSRVDPAIAFAIPLYLLIFGSVVVGIIIGGVADWMRQGRWRRAARENRVAANRWEKEAKALQSAAKADDPPAGVGALALPGSTSSAETR